MLCGIAVADAALWTCDGLKPKLVLQVVIFVKQHPHSSPEWLACLNKVRIEKNYCIAFLLSANNANLGHHAKAVLKS